MNSDLSKNHKDQESDLCQVYNAENELKLDLVSPTIPPIFIGDATSHDSLSGGSGSQETPSFSRFVGDTLEAMHRLGLPSQGWLPGDVSIHLN